MKNTTNYGLRKPEANEFADIADLNYNADIIDGAIKEAETQITQTSADYEYQTPTISGTQIILTRQSNTKRLVFKLEAALSGTITVSLDNGATSKNLVDIDGVQVVAMEKGFHEIVVSANFFILRNKGGLSNEDLQALITITNEAEANDSVLRTNYVNAVNSTDPSITLANNATWNDILLQIPNINSSNRKVASGTGISSNVVQQFRYVANENVLNYVAANVTLDFKPSVVILSIVNGSNISISLYDEVTPSIHFGAVKLATFNGANSTSITTLELRGNNLAAYVNETGFNLPLYYTSQINFSWTAFE